MPTWLGDFAIAEVLGIPVPEVRHQSPRTLYRAQVVLEARRIARETEKGEKA